MEKQQSYVFSMKCMEHIGIPNAALCATLFFLTKACEAEDTEGNEFLVCIYTEYISHWKTNILFCSAVGSDRRIYMCFHSLESYILLLTTS